MFADAMADDDGAIDAAGKIFFRLRLVLLTFDDLCFRLRLLFLKLKIFKFLFFLLICFQTHKNSHNNNNNNIK